MKPQRQVLALNICKNKLLLADFVGEMNKRHKCDSNLVRPTGVNQSSTEFHN